MVEHLICAHPDDALLGAYLLLLERKPHVVVLERTGYAGAFELARHLGYSCSWCPWDTESVESWLRVVEMVQESSGKLWLPSPVDANPHHRMVSTLGLLRRNVAYYSVLPVGYFVGSPRTLDAEQFTEKKRLFGEFFPVEAGKYGHILESAGPMEWYTSVVPVGWGRLGGPVPTLTRRIPARLPEGPTCWVE